ncbi:hypothetical protein O5O51_13425 [Sinirhodobacter sp. HNIBRBA609]|nr:hypothetical protein O5O51_13425 [Sinirhodobacter sp. HNIBRBA609]
MLELSRIRGGIWEGVILSQELPRVEVLHLGQVLEGLGAERLAEDKWRLSLPIPTEVLADGVQTFLVRDLENGEIVERFSIVTGAPLEQDLRAEIDLLRAELDMLKRAFRRHCAEAEG